MRWEAQVEKDFCLPVVDGIFRMAKRIRTYDKSINKNGTITVRMVPVNAQISNKNVFMRSRGQSCPVPGGCNLFCPGEKLGSGTLEAHWQDWGRGENGLRGRDLVVGE